MKRRVKTHAMLKKRIENNKRKLLSQEKYEKYFKSISRIRMRDAARSFWMFQNRERYPMRNQGPMEVNRNDRTNVPFSADEGYGSPPRIM